MKNLKGQWPLGVVMIMFFILPFSTIPGLFDFIFAVLGLMALGIAGLIIASVVTGLKQRNNER
ncbi:MAG: hypothetical protein RMN25_06425 [Anaerolineae bacterium]|nr:hypothetical protein [Thermoflexales bacterium]MDW8407404.1 hypothetical protein [Anaerolineae bacterium]